MERRAAMTSERAESLLAHDWIERQPSAVSEHLERLPVEEAAELVALVKPEALARVFRALSVDAALAILSNADPEAASALLLRLVPSQAGSLLGEIPEARRESILACLSKPAAADLRRLLEYPPETAGRLRDPRIEAFRGTTTVKQALQRLPRQPGEPRALQLFVVADDGRLVGIVPLHDAVLAEPSDPLASLIQGPPVSVSPFASRTEVVQTMERNRLTILPVVGPEGLPIGVLRLHELLREVGKEHSADLVSMTGASKDESALSGAWFAVRKRMPWLQINLLTAFLAATVVGLFQETIAQFTALAVLLPVVAGQSGNSGSQALAVAVRGLALREITVWSWPSVALKELATGAVNGIGVGIVASAGVYLWSQSVGLALVTGTSMVASMSIAGVAGAIIPMGLAALGQDPAQSSSILLTTVTDVFGFVTFLGLATLLSNLL